MTSAAAPAPFTRRQFLVVYAGLLAGLFPAALDQTIVATALPTIAGELRGLDYYSWAVAAYLVSATVCTPLFGKLGDVYGRRVTFQAAILIFLFGSALAAIAPGMEELVAFRGVQGVGAGGVISQTFAIIGDVVPARQRGSYLGYLAGVWAFAGIVGPLLGGFLVDHVTWRWVFLLNLPVGGVALAVVSVVLRLPPARRPARIDVVGAALLMAGVCLLLLALLQVQEGGARAANATTAGLLAAGGGLLAAFIRWEARVADPILPLRLFRNPVFTVASALGLIAGCALFGGVVFLPLFLQVVSGMSATGSGLLLLAFTAGIVAGSITSGRLTVSTGRYKLLAVAGSVCQVAGMSLLSLLHEETPPLATSIAMAVLGLGVGMLVQVSVLAVQNAAEHRDLGVVTASAQFFRSMGGSLGAAVLGVVMNARLAANLPDRLPPDALASVGGQVTELLNSPAAIRMLPVEVATAVTGSVQSALQTVFLSAVPIMVLGVALACLLKEIPLRETVGPATGE